MKKITLLIAMLIAFSWQSYAQFTENFDTEIPATWTVLNEDGGTFTWEHVTNYPHAGAGHARIHWESAAHNDYLISPQFSVTSGVSDRVNFYAGIEGTFWTETFEVRVSTAGTAAADFTDVIGSETATTDAAAANYTLYSYDLSAYDGDDIYVAIVATDTDRFYLAVDEFSVDTAPTDMLDFYNLQWPPTLTFAENEMTDQFVFAQAYEAGLTDTTMGQAPGIEVWIGYSSADTDPSGTGWTWEVASFNTEVGNNDEYAVAMQSLGLAEGTYYYASRFSLNSGPFTYGGILADGSNGGTWDGVTNISGVLTVTARVPVTGDDCSDPIIIGALPYNTTDDTAIYTDAFENGDSSCNGFYLSGNDVVYTYTPGADANINLTLSGLGGSWSGIHVLDACPTDMGASCVGFAGDSTSNDRSIDVDVVNGTTYYIVISTFAAPQSVAYTLDIAENTCENAIVTYTVVNDCAISGGFNIEVDITDMGTATDITVTDDQGSMAQTTMAATILTFGPYVNGTDVVITVADDNDASCTQSSSALTQGACPPANDTFAGATPIVPSAEGTGCATFNFVNSTAGDGTSDSGLDGSCNGADTGLDRFYSWTATTDGLIWNDGDGNPGIVIRDAATEAEITCAGTFAGDDTILSGWTIGQDLVIQIYDFQTADVDTSFCLELFTIPSPPANDLFADAIDVSCGDSVSGTTISATQDEADAPDVATVEADTFADNDSPWVWYSYDSSVSGAQVVTLSTCGVANTDFDTELFVYTGTSGNLTLIDDGYDECGGMAENYAAETTFTSDGSTTYYIAVGGYDTGDVGNFQLNITCVEPCDADAGTLTADATPVTLGASGMATISATPNGDIVVPTDYEVTYVLTSGASLVIEAAGATPSFDVDAAGDYTIHTLVAETSDSMDPNYLDLSVIVFGTTTGGDVLGLVTTNGLCADLDVTGAPITVEPCTADAGTLTADASPVELDGLTTISATPNGDIVVPTDYEVTYVLTSGASLVIEAAGATPSFDVTTVGDYTIHTLVAETSDNTDPNYVDLSVIVFGTTTGADVLGIVAGSNICADLDVTGAPITVEDLLSIDDNGLVSFTYYPNPVKNTLTLNAQNTIEGVTIFNMLGQEVFKAKPNRVDSELDMSSLDNGTYFVKVTIASNTKTIRVIKN